MPIRPFFEKMKASLDPDLQVLSDEDAVPRCPNCGEHMFLNARVDQTFIDAPYEQEMVRINRWLSKLEGKKLLLLELGAGYNTPTIVRIPLERIKAAQFRIHRSYASTGSTPGYPMKSATGVSRFETILRHSSGI